MTYIMHTSHAAKYGSRAGLGLTLIQYGYYSRQSAYEIVAAVGEAADMPLPTDAASFANGTWSHHGQGRHWTHVDGMNGTSTWPVEETTSVTPEMAASFAATRVWIAFILMAFGWIVLVSSVYGFWRVKRWETSIRSSSGPARASSTGTNLSEVRQRFRNAFRFRRRGNRDAEANAEEEMVPMVGAGATQAAGSAQPNSPATRMARLLHEAHLI